MYIANFPNSHLEWPFSNPRISFNVATTGLSTYRKKITLISMVGVTCIRISLISHNQKKTRILREHRIHYHVHLQFWKSYFQNCRYKVHATVFYSPLYCLEDFKLNKIIIVDAELSFLWLFIDRKPMKQSPRLQNHCFVWGWSVPAGCL